MAKTTQVQIRCTPTQKREWKRKAKRTGKTLSQWLINLAATAKLPRKP